MTVDDGWSYNTMDYLLMVHSPVTCMSFSSNLQGVIIINSDTVVQYILVKICSKGVRLPKSGTHFGTTKHMVDWSQKIGHQTWTNQNEPQQMIPNASRCFQLPFEIVTNPSHNWSKPELVTIGIDTGKLVTIGIV